MKNLINIVFLLFFVQFANSQIKQKYPYVMVLEKDTIVCFTTEQSKQMAVWNEQRKECVELRKNDNQKITELEKISIKKDTIISNLEKEIVLHKKTISDKETLINVCEDEKKALKKDIRKQRRGKWIAIICGVGLSLLFIAM
jgi:hypothetical protein